MTHNIHEDAYEGPPEPRPFAALEAGTPLPPLRVVVSAAANERYWRAAGVEHPALAAGALYPPIAANLTILCFLQVCGEAVFQTRQRLVCHRRGEAGAELVTSGHVAARYDKRGRTYVDVVATVAPAGTPADPLWTSEASFTPAAAPEPR
jgi:hypothetical protein